MSKNYEKDQLGIRMKQYEAVPKVFLTLGVPKIIRLDMRAGHTFCKNFKRPFDEVFSQCMIAATKQLCEDIPSVVLGYTQSDEISLVMNDISDKNTVTCFFDGNVEKMVSISASICTIAFNKKYMELVADMSDEDKLIYEPNLWKAQFDSRTYCLPNVTELHNYLLWRQLDATRNSIQMVGHANFNEREMHKKNTSQIQDMLMIEKGINWNNIPVKFKRGCALVKEQYTKDVNLPNGDIIVNVKRKRWIENEMPILTKDLNYIKDVFKRKLLVDGKFENVN